MHLLSRVLLDIAELSFVTRRNFMLSDRRMLMEFKEGKTRII